jgi:hypothetical protein
VPSKVEIMQRDLRPLIGTVRVNDLPGFARVVRIDHSPCLTAIKEATKPAAAWPPECGTVRMTEPTMADR